MKVYLDVCCLCRPFDDQTKTRIRLETEAVLTVLKRCSLDWEMVTSTAVLYEIGLISDLQRKTYATGLMDRALETIRVDNPLLSRAEEFEELGIPGMDAVHIACAERAGAVLLTTDRDLVKIMKRHNNSTLITVENVLEWLIEVNHHGE